MLDVRVKTPPELAPGEYEEIIALTTRAFQRDYTPYMESFVNPTHVLARCRDKLVSYVCWVTRWLQINEGPLLKTAYIEGLATDSDYRHRGFALQVVRRAMAEVQGFDIAATSTGLNDFFSSLRWQVWQGPLYCRKGQELISMPGEQGCVMVFPLPKSPPLDLNQPLSIEWRELEPW